MENLKTGLPAGATIYVIGIVDIYQLWEIAQDKKALGIVDCEVLWATTLLDLFPCGTMLNPLNDDADRWSLENRNIAFNKILKTVTEEYNAMTLITTIITLMRPSTITLSKARCLISTASIHLRVARKTYLSSLGTWDLSAPIGSNVIG